MAQRRKKKKGHGWGGGTFWQKLIIWLTVSWVRSAGSRDILATPWWSSYKSKHYRASSSIQLLCRSDIKHQSLYCHVDGPIFLLPAKADQLLLSEELHQGTPTWQGVVPARPGLWTSGHGHILVLGPPYWTCGAGPRAAGQWAPKAYLQPGTPFPKTTMLKYLKSWRKLRSYALSITPHCLPFI